MLQDYTQVPQWGAQCTYTPRIRERELTMVNKCTKTIFFFYLRLKTLTRHPLSGNEMIEYCYCKTRPLKILTVCSRDTWTGPDSAGGSLLPHHSAAVSGLSSNCSFFFFMVVNMQKKPIKIHQSLILLTFYFVIHITSKANCRHSLDQLTRLRPAASTRQTDGAGRNGAACRDSPQTPPPRLLTSTVSHICISLYRVNAGTVPRTAHTERKKHISIFKLNDFTFKKFQRLKVDNKIVLCHRWKVKE